MLHLPTDRRHGGWFYESTWTKWKWWCSIRQILHKSDRVTHRDVLLIRILKYTLVDTRSIAVYWLLLILVNTGRYCATDCYIFQQPTHDDWFYESTWMKWKWKQKYPRCCRKSDRESPSYSSDLQILKYFWTIRSLIDSIAVPGYRLTINWYYEIKRWPYLFKVWFKISSECSQNANCDQIEFHTIILIGFGELVLEDLEVRTGNLTRLTNVAIYHFIKQTDICNDPPNNNLGF